MLQYWLQSIHTRSLTSTIVQEMGKIHTTGEEEQFEKPSLSLCTRAAHVGAFPPREVRRFHLLPFCELSFALRLALLFVLLQLLPEPPAHQISTPSERFVKLAREMAILGTKRTYMPH